MSTDSNADTVMVKNILAHVLSPKIVTDVFNTGYETKVDIVNVDNIVAQRVIFSNAQTGVFTTSATSVPIINTKVTENSIIFTTIIDTDNVDARVRYVKAEANKFTIYFQNSDNSKVGWFIAKF